MTDGSLAEIDICGPEVVHPGERLVAQTSGGGGYGRPETREPELVLADVREGWISAERARTTYRVHVEHDAIDHDETARLRASRARRNDLETSR
jgi:N-methylhydantoinase B